MHYFFLIIPLFHPKTKKIKINIIIKLHFCLFSHPYTNIIVNVSRVGTTLGIVGGLDNFCFNADAS